MTKTKSSTPNLDAYDSVFDAVSDLKSDKGAANGFSTLKSKRSESSNESLAEPSPSTVEAVGVGVGVGFGTIEPLSPFEVQMTPSAFEIPTAPPNVIQFQNLVSVMASTYARKNEDYGDSFGKSVDRYGPIAALTRMSDKWNRLENLMLKGKEGLVADESLKDTLIDLACYCVMTVIALDK